MNKKVLTAFFLGISICFTGCQVERTEPKEGSNTSYNIVTEPQSTEAENEETSNLIQEEPKTLTKVKFSDACCNDGCVIALTSDGNVVTWGNNYNGKIGNGKRESHIPGTECTPVEPYLLEFPENIINVGASHLSSYALTDTGEVYMWGINSFGELGISAEDVLTPQKLPLNEKIKKVDTFNATTMFLSTNGEVFVSGIDILQYDDLWTLNEEVCYEGGSSEEPIPHIKAEPGYRKIELPFSCKDVSVGVLHYCFLSDDGDVYIQGTLLGDYNGEKPNLKHDELYQIAFPEKIKSIDSGSNYIVALSESGNVFLYGEKEAAFFDEQSDTEVSENIFLKGKVKDCIYIECNSYNVFMIDSASTSYGFGMDMCGSIDISKSDNDPRTYEIISQPIALNYKNVKKCSSDMSDSVFIIEDGEILIQGSDQMKQISFLGE